MVEPVGITHCFHQIRIATTAEVRLIRPYLRTPVTGLNVIPRISRHPSRRSDRIAISAAVTASVQIGEAVRGWTARKGRNR
jgi:hypothetical protein